MLYYDFNGYEGFKEIFGIVEHGNGVKSRKNKILLALYKDRNFLRRHISAKAYYTASELTEWSRVKWDKNTCKYDYMYYRYRRMRDSLEENAMSDLLQCTSLPLLKSMLMYTLGKRELRKSGAYHILNLNGEMFYSDAYMTDDMTGLCEDGTLNAIRYYNIEKDRVFKMRAGKMFNHILSCNVITDMLPEQIKRWLSEEWVADWIEYARETIGENGYVLHVDDNFEGIYSREKCAGYDKDSDAFRSCMQGDGQWKFYRDAVKAKAAYLTDADDMIVARCIIFTEVKENEDDSGKVWRLAERQYSKFYDLTLQRQLVNALIRGGYIDGYKKVGASCHDGSAFVDNEGNSLEDKRFYISCKLEDGDTLSYQDSFKSYDYDEGIATNFGGGSYDLDITDRKFNLNDDDGDGDDDDHSNESWSDYNNCYIDSDEAYYVETREDYFYSHQTVYAKVWDSWNNRFYEEDCCEDDVVEINGDYYYVGRDGECPGDYHISQCPYCGNYFVENDGYFSEYMNEEYCSDECATEAEHDAHVSNGEEYSDYDEKWYDASEVITALVWLNWRCVYEEETISIESFNDLVEEYEATEYLGRYYVDDINMEGEPVHQAQAAAA